MDEGKTPQDVLNEIMDRAMPDIPNPPEEAPEEHADAGEQRTSEAEKQSSSSDVSRETPEEEQQPTPSVKNKPSSVYIYLAVLFGAAFLMLLLAYFVQQRNNDAVLDDLRTTTASREELLEDIQRLEEQNGDLQKEVDYQKSRVEQVKEERENLKQQVDNYQYAANISQARTALSNALGWLERFVAEKDWLMAGVAVETLDYLYNEHNKEYSGGELKPTVSQTARYFELREEVFDKAGCMVMETFYSSEDESEYTERPYIGEGIFDEQDYETAKSLLSAILYYPDSLDIPAGFFHEYFRRTDSSLERLNSGAFQPSTVELYQQVRADILAAGELMEVNGELVGIPNGG